MFYLVFAPLIIVYIGRIIGPVTPVGDLNDITCRVVDGAIELIDIRIIGFDYIHYGYGIGIGLKGGSPWSNPGRNKPRGFEPKIAGANV